MPYDTYTATGMQHGRARTWKKAGNVELSYYGMKLSSSAGGYITMTPEFAELFEDASKAGDRIKVSLEALCMCTIQKLMSQQQNQH